MSMTNCKWVRNADGNGGSRQCTTVDQKWTYAIPLEIIYMTPLSSWNPYNLEYKGKYSYYLIQITFKSSFESV